MSASHASPETPPVRMSARRVVLASTIGTCIEWYDYYIFGIASALAIGPQFFPSYSPAAATFAAFATFAVGSIAKPIGAVVFGHYGDRIGRKSALVMSLLLMGFGTVLVGVLPNYASIGVWAPLLLVTLRIIQGIGIGGEWGGAALMAAEYAPNNRRGFFVSWPQFGSPAGLLLSTSVFLGTRSMLSPAQFSEWGWRIPFLLSGVLIVVGLVIRLKITETPQFRKIQEAGAQAKIPLWEAIRTRPGTMLLVGGTFLFNTLAFFVVTTFLLSYATNVVHLPGSIALSAQLVGGVTLAIGVPVAAIISDRIGRKRTIISLYLAWLIWVWPMFYIIDSGTPAAFIAVVAFGTLLTSAYGPIGAFLLEQFETRIRYTGASVGLMLGSVVGAGFGPLVTLKVQAAYGSFGISVFIACMAAFSALCASLLKDRSQQDIEVFEDAVATPGEVLSSALHAARKV